MADLGHPESAAPSTSITWLLGSAGHRRNSVFWVQIRQNMVQHQLQNPLACTSFRVTLMFPLALGFPIIGPPWPSLTVHSHYCNLFHFPNACKTVMAGSICFNFFWYRFIHPYEQSKGFSVNCLIRMKFRISKYFLRYLRAQSLFHCNNTRAKIIHNQEVE